MMSNNRFIPFVIITLATIIVLIVAIRIFASSPKKEVSDTVLLVSELSSEGFEEGIMNRDQQIITNTEQSSDVSTSEIIQPLDLPVPLKAVYMTSWIAATPSLRENLIAFIQETEINAVVIDIKDSTGKISFTVNDPYLQSFGTDENRIKNIDELLNRFQEMGIYTIGRISVFQDPYLTNKRPDLAIKKKSDGGVWKDRKGLAFLDPTNQEVWDYIVALSRESALRGFDEINFDYIRFPSDGVIADIDYPHDPTETRADTLEKFFAFLDESLNDLPIITSADVFGMVTTQQDDLGIGQILEQIVPYFNYVAPMIYPSHYPKTFLGFSNPAEKPYEVISYALQKGIERVERMGYDKNIIRPWLQDFNLGAVYTKEMVRKQIQATYDTGLHSWMMWDPANTYTTGAYLLKE